MVRWLPSPSGQPALPDLITLKQVADRLQLSERTVYRLLQRGDLPGRKIGGQWRFRISEIDYWLDLRMGRMRSPDLQRLESDTTVSLTRALAEANALIELAPGARREVITGFVGRVAFPEPVDPALLAARVLEREELSSTATVDGVAFLHTARWESRMPVQSPLAALGRLPTPIDFGAVDRTPTDLLFLLLAPDDRTHLTLLARAARLCRDPVLLSELRAAASGREVRRLIEAAERAVFALEPEPER